MTALQSGISSRDVLPHYMRLLHARQPGSYGLAHEMYLTCRGAMGSAIPLTLDREGAKQEEGPATARAPEMRRPEIMARRVAAAQEIQRRCEPVLQMGPGEQFVEGDPHARRRQVALRELMGNNHDALLGASGAELANQGLLFTQADDALANPSSGQRFFEGKALTASVEVNAFRLALSLARGEMTLGPSPAADNLIALTACAGGSSCDGNWQAGVIQDTQASSAEVAKARELLPRIKAALEANNLDAFRPPPKR